MTTEKLLRLHNDDLARKANLGNEAAISEFFQNNMPGLRRWSAWLVRGAPILDADDLLSEATASLISRWKAGNGPEAKANAYVIRSMRNRIVDELRSPRSRVVSLSNHENNITSMGDPFDVFESSEDRRYVRAAFSRLTDAEQFVIRSVLIEGEKPAKVAKEMGRSPAGVYSLAWRARAHLWAELLRSMVADCFSRECVAAAKELPAIFPTSLDDDERYPGLIHLQVCFRCNRIWKDLLRREDHSASERGA